MKILRKLKNLRYRLLCILSRIDIDTKYHFSVLLDLIYCKIFLRCTTEEYLIYGLHRFKNLYRKNFIMANTRRRIYEKINPAWYTKHKRICYEKIRRGMSREILYVPECGEKKFLDFVKKHHTVITKPDVGSCGRNIQIHKYTSDEEALAFFKTLPPDTICEEYIKQHQKLGSLNPHSVNSIRICSLCDNGNVEFISAAVRSGGTADSIVDNINQRGIGAKVDIQSGVVIGKGYDYHGRSYIYHPVTGTQIVGLSIPYWDEALELIRKTHLDVADCPFLGWDIAIAENGPEIIEINGAPGTKLMQSLDQTPKGKKLFDYIKKHKKLSTKH